jgi:hypothetical protein
VLAALADHKTPKEPVEATLFLELLLLVVAVAAVLAMPVQLQVIMVGQQMATAAVAAHKTGREALRMESPVLEIQVARLVEMVIHRHNLVAVAAVPHQ